MKNILALILILFLLSSCATQMIQVFDTSTTNTKLVDSNWVFENDTVKIVYSFWESNGKMEFTVYNKLNKPIYIDWKNSSFIYNGNKLDYWIEEQKTSQASSAAYYKGIIFQGSSSTTVKPEKVTFIPPNSLYSRSPKFHLQPTLLVVSHAMENQITVPNYINPKKTDTIIQENFTFSDSPLKFRNYLAFSFSENSESFFFVDDEFYLSSVKEMTHQTFLGIPIKWDDGKPTGYGKSPYQHQTSFYIQFSKK
jgi:hypothetical protein